MYRIKEMSDVFVDACIRTETGELMFLSCYGRDTAIQQFLAAFSLGPQEGGLLQFTLLDNPPKAHLVRIGAHERLTKLTGRLPKANLFGNLTHTWIYDPALTNAGLDPLTLPRAFCCLYWRLLSNFVLTTP